MDINWVQELPTIDAMYPIRMCCYDEGTTPLHASILPPFANTVANKQEELHSNTTCPIQLNLAKTKWLRKIQGFSIAKITPQCQKKCAKSPQRTNIRVARSLPTKEVDFPAYFMVYEQGTCLVVGCVTCNAP